ncbi:MAG TPA: NepR family anti-sigma factor [Allosphingosinicella sp.]|nr:NepR family anti-sigma factor [Allosphingosinicella sp.]
MSLQDDRESGRRRKSGPAHETDSSPVPRRKRRKLSDEPEIGSALRSIYDKALEETIPREMLDLLGKLD